MSADLHSSDRLPSSAAKLVPAVAVALLVALAGALRWIVLRRTINWYNEEPFFYLYDTVQFLRQPFHFPLVANHPGGYQYLLALLIRLGGIHDVVALGRYLSFVLGTATVIPLFLLVRRALGDWTGWLAGAALAIYSTHILLSVNSLNFAPFFFFLLTGCWLFGESLTLVGSARRSWAALIGAALCFVAAGTLRFESWLFIVPLVVWLGWKKQWRRAAVFGALTAAFPLLYLAFARAKYGDFFPFLEVSGGIDRAFSGWLDWRAAGVWGRELSREVGLVPLAAGVVGIVLGLQRRHQKELLLYLGLVAAFYLFRTMRHRFIFAGVFPRYDVLPLLFFLPYAFSAAIDLTRRIKTARSWAAAALALPILLAFGWQSAANFFHVVDEEGLAAAPPATRSLIDWMKRELRPDEPICLDFWLHPTVLYSLIEAKGLAAPPYAYPFHPCLEHGRDCRAEGVDWPQIGRDFLASENCRVVISRSNEPLYPLLAAPDSPFVPVAEVDPYRIYRRAAAP
ncbi:MAG: hypothetical protein GX444_16820 [Myxococcales bacterium]|nr:hypothetical protein [Myxococcales bacterium]